MAYSHDIFLWDNGSAFNIKLSDQGLSLVVNGAIQAQYSQTVGFQIRVNDTTQLSSTENTRLNDHNPGDTILSNVGSFNLIVQAAGGTQSITGIGFRPKLVLFWWSGIHDTGSAAMVTGQNNEGFSVATSSSSRWVTDIYTYDAQISSAYAYSSSGSVIVLAYNLTFDGRLDISSMDADGFTLDVVTAVGYDYKISYLALGGDEISDIYLGTYTSPTTTGSFSVAGLGFEPSAIIFQSINSATVEKVSTTVGTYSLGFAANNGNNGADNTIVSGYSADLSGANSSSGYSYNQESVALFTGVSSISLRESVMSFTNDGFIVNHLEGASARVIFFAALRGGKYGIGELTTKTNTDSFSNTVGFKPSAVLFASSNRALSTQDTPTVNNFISIGAASGSSSNVQGVHNYDNVDLGLSDKVYYESNVYVSASGVYPSTWINGLMHLRSFQNTGFVSRMTYVDLSEKRVAYLAIGGIPAANSYSLDVNDSTQGQTCDFLTLTVPGFIYQGNAAISFEYKEAIPHVIQSNAAIMVEYTYHFSLITNNAIQLQTSDNITFIIAGTLTVQDSTQLQNSDNINLTQHYPPLTVQNTSHLQTSDNIDLTQHYMLVISDIIHLQTAENIILTQHHILTVSDIIHFQNSDNIDLTQHYTSSTDNTTHIQISDNVNLTQHHVLVVNDTTQLQTCDNINLIQHYMLITSDAIELQISDNIVLTQHHILIISDTIHFQTSDNIVLTQHYLLSINDSYQIHVSDFINLTQHHILVIDNASHSQIADNINLTQHQILVINDSTQLQVSDNTVLNYHAAEAFVIDVINITQLQTSDNIILTQHHILSINDSVQIQNADNINLTQHHILSANDSTQIQTVDNIILTQNYLLLINNSNHLQSSDNIILTQHHLLSIGDSSQLQNCDNIILTQHYILSANDSSQLQNSDNIILTQHHILSIDDSSQLQNSENIILTQRSTLSPDNSTHLQSCENIILIQNYNLIVNNSLHLQTCENIILTQHNNLAINDSIQLQLSDNIILTQHYILSINDSTQIQICDNLIGLGFVIQNPTQIQSSGNIILTQHYNLEINNCSQIHTADKIEPRIQIYSKVDSFSVNSDLDVGEIQSITGLGFRPKIIIVWWAGAISSTSGIYAETYNIGFGAAISSSNRFCINGVSNDASLTAAVRKSHYNTEIIRCYTTSSTLDGILDFYSMDSDGFSFIVDDKFSWDRRIDYMALGGDGLEASISASTMATSTGNHSVTGIGFQPDAMIFATNLLTSLNTTSVASINYSVGIGTDASKQGVIMGYVQGGATTSNTSGYGYGGEILSGLGSHRESLVSLDSDGFTLNHLEGTTAYYYSYICLKGGKYSVGSFNTRTDGDDIVTTLEFPPKALLFLSANRAQSTQDTVTDNAKISIGAVSSVSDSAVQAIYDEDNLSAAEETALASYDNKIYAHITHDTIVGLMSVKSITENILTTVMDTPDATTCWVTYLAIGSEGEKFELIVNDAIQLQAAENLRITTNIYILRVDDCIQIQTSENTILITNIVILKMGDCVQLQTSENIIFSIGKKVIYAYRKISFGIGKNGPGL